MKSFRQVIRQPMKFIAGLILMTVAAAIVCVCVGQALAARSTAIELEKQFTTVVLPKGEGRIDANGVRHTPVEPSGDFLTWLEEMAQTQPEIVKSVETHGLLSASIPELDPLNYTQGGYIDEKYTLGDRSLYRYGPQYDGRPYSGAMFVITLDEISEPVELLAERGDTVVLPKTAKDFASPEFFYNWLVEMEETGDLATVGYIVTLSGTITDVISLQKGFRDPTGMTARLSISLPTVEWLNALELEVGQSYLVYGMDYYDEDWAFRSHLADKRGNNLSIDAFDPSQLHLYYAKEDLNQPDFPHSKIAGKYTVTLSGAQDSDEGIPVQVQLSLTAGEINRINAVSMTLWKSLKYISYEEYANINQTAPYVDRRKDVTYRDQNGEEITMTWEEYTKRYQIPTFVKLEGSVEDFLQSEEGAPWREALERDEVNHHAFAVLGTNKTMSLGWFAQQEAKITQGRDITDEEAAIGARVCLIQEDVALANGLHIGDTITLNYYRGDNGLPYQGLRDNTGDLLMPSADFYFSTTPILETAEYTVVGLWKGPDTWPDLALNEFSLSPNTVIVPKTSVQTEWEYPNSVLYTSAILNNGSMTQFKRLARQAYFHADYACFDQGYKELVGNFHDFEELAIQMLIVGMVVYAVILLLFLLLYPGAEGKTVWTMESLGVPRWKRFGHVINSAVGIAAPATILGGGLGMALWQTVVDALQTTVESAVVLQLDPTMLISLALAQLALVLALTAVLAVFISAPRGISRKKN